MQEIFEKIIELLTQKENEAVLKAPNTRDIANTEYQKWMMKSYGFKEAIEIVKQEAEKYDNGWIPCSERLPKKNGYYYVTEIVKSISTGKKIAIEKAYVEFSEGKWRRAKHLEVIAWIDIEPYQPKGE